MSEVRESSLLFSLDSLFAHERDKVETERKEAERQRQAAIEAEARAERARLEARARFAAESRERAIAEERRVRDDEARLEGIRQAELERVRLETQRKSDAEIAERRSRHEVELRALALATRTKRLRAVLVGVAAVGAVGVLGTVGYALFSQAPELERLRAASVAARANEDARANELRGMLTEAERKRRALEAELATRAQPTASTATAPTATVPAQRPAGTWRPARPTTPPGGTRRPAPCTGDAHDPLNPCLGG